MMVMVVNGGLLDPNVCETMAQNALTNENGPKGHHFTCYWGPRRSRYPDAFNPLLAALSKLFHEAFTEIQAPSKLPASFACLCKCCEELRVRNILQSAEDRFEDLDNAVASKLPACALANGVDGQSPVLRYRCCCSCFHENVLFSQAMTHLEKRILKYKMNQQEEWMNLHPDASTHEDPSGLVEGAFCLLPCPKSVT